jgi:hypothetical protein
MANQYPVLSNALNPALLQQQNQLDPQSTPTFANPEQSQTDALRGSPSHTFQPGIGNHIPVTQQSQGSGQFHAAQQHPQPPQPTKEQMMSANQFVMRIKSDFLGRRELLIFHFWYEI